MTIDFVPEKHIETKPRITVFGIGGAGGNAINNMISGQLEGVEFVVANTDSQSLERSLCEERVRLGINLTSGLGAGARPDIGKTAAEEALDDIQRHLEGNNMVFIAAGMGGGTGTGGAPVIARAAREHGILTVGVVTKPFQFEGNQRMRIAELGIQELHQYVDTLIVIPNQNLFRVASDQTTFADAFKMADDVLHAGVRGVTDLMVNPGLINLDFADIRMVMSEMGKAMMGTGEAEGENRAAAAAEAAINNPLLDNASIKGAHGILINVTGGTDITLHEVDEAASRICGDAEADANIIFGTSLDEQLDGRMRVSVIATGIETDEARAPAPQASDKVHVLGFSERKSDAASAAARVSTEAADDPASAEAPADDRAPAAVTEAAETVAGTPLAETAGAGAQSSAAAAVSRSVAAPRTRAEPAIEPAQPRSEHRTVAANAAGAIAARIAAPAPEPRSERPTPARETLDGPARPNGENGSSPLAGGERNGAVRRFDASTDDAARKPTLFERMTGTGRARREVDEEEPGAAAPRVNGTAALSAGPESRMPPVLGPAPTTPAAEALGERTAPAPEPQLDPLPTPAAMAADTEDPLDIPSFLRRQAN